MQALLLIVWALLVGAVQAQTIVITQGTVKPLKSGALEVTDAAVRASIKEQPGEQASITVTYGGPTEVASKLASGQYQSQIGLKLRETNQCNLVYVMRRFEPVSELAVLVKRNDGQTTHAQCEDHGYTKLVSIPLERARPGQTFSLSARFVDEATLRVRLNGRDVWVGKVESFNLGYGQAGIRSDNARYTVKIGD